MTNIRGKTIGFRDRSKTSISLIHDGTKEIVRIDRYQFNGAWQGVSIIDRDDLPGYVKALSGFLPEPAPPAVDRKPTEADQAFYASSDEWLPARKANAPELHEDPPAPTTSPDLESGLSMLTHAKADLRTPRVVCLCGSLRRALEAFRAANLAETLAGNIVLSVPAVGSDEEEFGHLSPEKLAAEKARMDALHLRKIELADEVLILNVGGYIGESTRRELEYAIKLRKRVRFLEANKAAG